MGSYSFQLPWIGLYNRNDGNFRRAQDEFKWRMVGKEVVNNSLYSPVDALGALRQIFILVIAGLRSYMPISASLDKLLHCCFPRRGSVKVR